MDTRKLADVAREWWPVGCGAGAVLVAGLSLSGSAARRRRKGQRAVSVWWDVDGPATIRYLDRHIRNLKALGVSVCIMFTNLDGTMAFTGPEIARFTSALRSAGIPFGIDVWAYPTAGFIRWIPNLIEVVGATGATWAEFDVEANWTGAKADGYSRLDEAARSLASAMSACPVPWGITTNMGRISSDAVGIGIRGQFVVPQAYSVYRSDDPRAHHPGAYQEHAYRRTRDIYGPRIAVVMGLAAYGQEGFPGITPVDAMLKATAASFVVGVREVRFWSWKWIGGHDGMPRNRYAYDALAQIRARFT